MHSTEDIKRYWVSTVSVNSYIKGIPRGHLHNPFFEQPQMFESLTEFLKIMECMLDLTNQPRAFNSARHFGHPPRQDFEAQAVSPADRGELATFALCIRFRRNSSWQGQLHWLEEGKKQNFRSVLELISLMDSALQIARRRRDNAKENSA